MEADQSRGLKTGSAVYKNESELQRLNRVGRQAKPKVLWNDILAQTRV